MSDASDVKNYRAVQNKTEAGILQQAVIPGRVKNREQTGDSMMVSQALPLSSNVWLSLTVYIPNIRSLLIYSLQAYYRIAE